jgi:hypothetical protein
LGGGVTAGDTVVPEFLKPGTTEYREQKVQWLRKQLMYVEGDCEPFADNAAELRENGEYAHYTDGELDWDRFCREVLGTEPGFINSVIDGVQHLKRRGYTGPMGADGRGNVQPLGKPGAPKGNQNASNTQNNLRNHEHCSGKRQDNASYIEARLARDAQTDPQAADVMERYGRGELTAHAAAVEMGWRKQQTRTTKFRSLWRNATDEERAQIEQDINDWHKGRWK